MLNSLSHIITVTIVLIFFDYLGLVKSIWSYYKASVIKHVLPVYWTVSKTRPLGQLIIIPEMFPSLNKFIQNNNIYAVVLDKHLHACRRGCVEGQTHGELQYASNGRQYCVKRRKRWIKIYTQFCRIVFHNEVQWFIIITWIKPNSAI